MPRKSPGTPRTQLPPLSWDGDVWKGQIVLRTWHGFQTRQGPYSGLSSDQPSDGTARLFVHGGEADHPTPEQAAAYRYLIEQEKAVSDSVLQVIFDGYPDEREAFLDAVDEELADLCPEIDRPEQLKSLMGLDIVHILPIPREGLAYVGFEFGCVWESEHGLGVMTYGDRIVQIGSAATAFNYWVARADGGEL